MARQEFLQDRLNLSSSLRTAFSCLPAAVSAGVMGMAVYNAVSEDDVAVLANLHGPRSDQSHKDFLANRILDSRIPLAGTSLQASLSDVRVVSTNSSGYRPDQICMNMRVGQGGYNRAPPMISIVFDRQAFSARGAKISDLEAQLPGMFGAAGLDNTVAGFDRKYKGRLPDHLDLGEGRPKEAFLLYCDLQGSTQIGEHYGFPDAYEFMRFMGQEIYNVVERHGGYGVRANGDDVLSIFPCTDLNDADKAVFFKGSVLKASADIHRWYDGFKGGLKADSALHSKMMMAASYGVHMPVRLNSRFNDVTHDGEPFYRVSELMKALKARSKRCSPVHGLVIDETVVPYAPRTEMKRLSGTKMPPSQIVREMKVLDF